MGQAFMTNRNRDPLKLWRALVGLEAVLLLGLLVVGSRISSSHTKDPRRVPYLLSRCPSLDALVDRPLSQADLLHHLGAFVDPFGLAISAGPDTGIRKLLQHSLFLPLFTYRLSRIQRDLSLMPGPWPTARWSAKDTIPEYELSGEFIAVAYAAPLPDSEDMQRRLLDALGRASRYERLWLLAHPQDSKRAHSREPVQADTELSRRAAGDSIAAQVSVAPSATASPAVDEASDLDAAAIVKTDSTIAKVWGGDVIWLEKHMPYAIFLEGQTVYSIHTYSKATEDGHGTAHHIQIRIARDRHGLAMP